MALNMFDLPLFYLCDFVGSSTAASEHLSDPKSDILGLQNRRKNKRTKMDKDGQTWTKKDISTSNLNFSAVSTPNRVPSEDFEKCGWTGGPYG